MRYYITSVSSLNLRSHFLILGTKIANTHQQSSSTRLKYSHNTLKSTLTTKTSHSNHSINMSEATFHTTREDIRKAESKISQNNDGNVPADSEPSQMKVNQSPSHFHIQFPKFPKLTPTSSQSSTKINLNPNLSSSKSVKPTYPSQTSPQWPQIGTRATLLR